MAVSSPLPLAPGATIGILGNGQLGRMLCLAAARLGYRSHVYGPEPDSPAQQVATYSTEAAYDNQAMLKTFADSVQVVTFEFENVPAQAASYLATHTAVRPSWRALDIAQDRTKEKTFFAEIGAATPPWRAVDSLAELEAAISHMGTPAILKTSRLGYDGKGQAKISKPGDAKSAWTAIGGARAPASGNFAILEGFVDFSKEISVIAARGHDGATICSRTFAQCPRQSHPVDGHRPRGYLSCTVADGNRHRHTRRNRTRPGRIAGRGNVRWK